MTNNTDNPYLSMSLEEAIQVLTHYQNGWMDFEPAALRSAQKIVRTYSRPGYINWIQLPCGTWALQMTHVMH